MTISQKNHLIARIDEISAHISQLEVSFEHQPAKQALLAKLQAAANQVLSDRFSATQWQDLVAQINRSVLISKGLSPNHYEAKILNQLLKNDRSENQIQPVHKNRYLQL